MKDKDIVEIDYKKTKEFFEKRANKKSEVSYLSLTMYQDRNPGLAEQRDREEKAVMLPLLEFDKNANVLDIGCGAGRWASVFAEKVNAYLGLDFSEELLRIGKLTYANYPEIYFQKMSATELEPKFFVVQKPFDLIIVSGLLIYLNDSDIKNLISVILEVSKIGTRLYLREPISLLSERKLLIDHFSEDLDSFYNAIYRTQNDLEKLIIRPLLNNGFSIKYNDFLFKSDLLNTRKDTRQYYYILKK